MRLKLISCEVFYRELCETVARSPHQVDLEFLPKGLHDIGCAGMQARLQNAIDAVPPDRFDAITLGYGLCASGWALLALASAYGLSRLASRATPIAVARYVPIIYGCNNFCSYCPCSSR